MERVPRTGVSVYRQHSPPPDILPLVDRSAESVPVEGLSVVVPAVLRSHVPIVYVAHMVLVVQAMCNLTQVAQVWAASMASQTMVQH